MRRKMTLEHEIKHVLLRMRPFDFYRLHASAQEAGDSLNRHVNELIKKSLDTQNTPEMQKTDLRTGI